MSTNGSPSTPRLTRFSVFIGLAITILASPLPAAGQHRAKLANDLAGNIGKKADSTVNVLYEGPQAEVDRIAQVYGLRVVRRLDSGAVFAGTGRQFDRAANDANISDLQQDNRVISTMAVTTASTGANQMWARGSNPMGGYTGLDINVVVIDSGFDATNLDIKNRIVACPKDYVAGTTDTCVDPYGHGTHVAGSIAGTGRGDATLKGMAPGAGLISLRVLGPDGSGNVSDVIDAINWSIRNKDRYKIRVINLSLGHPATTSYRLDLMAKAVERAVKAGIVVCASAGNLGKTDDGTPVIGGIVSPGYTPGAVTVGALNTHGTVSRDDDGVATYSSRGPVGDPNVPSTWEIKPDLVAPGNAIVAAGAVGSYLFNHYPTLQVYGSNGGTYLKLSGASMATAVTSGAVAQILQANPDLSPAEVKFALQYSAEALPGFGLIEQGAGSLDVPMAVAVARSSNLSRAVPESVQIGGSNVYAGHIAFGMVHGNSDTIVWGSSDTIVWGSSDTIVWGSSDTIIWGSTLGWGSTAVWGNVVKGNTIYWGAHALEGRPLQVRGSSDTIIWGSLSDTIVWGSLSDTIVWGSLSDTIVWGSSDTIVWGSSDTIVWGSFSDTIVWGSSDTIVWGSFSDTIVWGSSDTIVWGSRSCGAPPDEFGEQRPCSGG